MRPEDEEGTAILQVKFVCSQAGDAGDDVMMMMNMGSLLLSKIIG